MLQLFHAHFLQVQKQKKVKRLAGKASKYCKNNKNKKNKQKNKLASLFTCFEFLRRIEIFIYGSMLPVECIKCMHIFLEGNTAPSQGKKKRRLEMCNSGAIKVSHVLINNTAMKK